LDHLHLANELPNRHYAFFGTFGVRKELQDYFASFFHLFGAPFFDITVDKPAQSFESFNDLPSLALLIPQDAIVPLNQERRSRSSTIPCNPLSRFQHCIRHSMPS